MSVAAALRLLCAELELLRELSDLRVSVAKPPDVCTRTLREAKRSRKRLKKSVRRQRPVVDDPDSDEDAATREGHVAALATLRTELKDADVAVTSSSLRLAAFERHWPEVACEWGDAEGGIVPAELLPLWRSGNDPSNYASFVPMDVVSRNKVFLATSSDGVTTVVKRFDIGSGTKSGQTLRACFKEARLLRRVGHPAIAEIRALWQYSDPAIAGTYLCVEMPHYAQGQLDAWVASATPTRAVLRQVFREILSALAHLHAFGVVHRDVKPANILMHNNQPR